MDESVEKKIDESWKEQAEREKQGGSAALPETAPHAGSPPTPAESAGSRKTREELPPVRFDLFVSGLAVEALVATGDMPHPTTRKPAANLPHARYLIDLLGVLEEKTKGNLTVEEEKLLTDALYQLRMRYLAKAGGS